MKTTSCSESLKLMSYHTGFNKIDRTSPYVTICLLGKMWTLCPNKMVCNNVVVMNTPWREQVCTCHVLCCTVNFSGFPTTTPIPSIAGPTNVNSSVALFLKNPVIWQCCLATFMYGNTVWLCCTCRNILAPSRQLCTHKTDETHAAMAAIYLDVNCDLMK